MDSNTINASLGTLSESQISIAEKEKILSYSFFDFIEISGNEAGNYKQVRLEVRDNFLLQTCLEGKQIVSGFSFDYTINFQVIRSSCDKSMTLGFPQEIQFIQQNNKRINFFVKQTRILEFENFLKTLQTRYIVQLKFHQSFKAIKILGKGVTATVYKAIRFQDQREVAIKSFKRSIYFQSQNGNGKKAFEKQFKFMTNIKHPNLINFYGVYQSQNSTYIIMQYLQLSLFGWLQKYGFPFITTTKKILIQLLQGVEYLHSIGIMHRDLKLENIMVKKNVKENVQVVIVDLGLAENWVNQKFLYMRCGTPGYVAPEILKIKNSDPQRYQAPVDIFSLGIIFHMLVFKKSVFEGADVKQVIKKNTMCEINFNSPHFQSLSAEGKDLMMKMLEKDPEKRITATQALNHSFLKQTFKDMKKTSVNIEQKDIESKI